MRLELLPTRSCLAPLILIGTARTQEPELALLVEALGDPERAVAAQVELASRDDAMAELGDVVLHGVPSLPEDRQTGARWAALQVLVYGGPRGLPALPCLLDAMASPYVPADMMDHVVAAVGRIGMHAGAGRHELIEALRRGRLPDGPPLRHEAKARLDDLITRLHVDGAGSWKELRRALHSDHPIDVAAACEALHDRRSDFDGLADEVGGELVAFLEGGARARGWVPKLPSVQMRVLLTTASEALLRYDPDHPATWLGWSQRLFHYDPQGRVEAAQALGALRQPDALRWLLLAARNGPDEVALAVLDALRRYGPAASHVAADLRRSLPRLGEAPREQAEQLLRILEPAADAIEHDGPPIELVGVGMERVPGAEKTRLEDWLDARQGENRSRLQRDPVYVEEYPVRDVRWVPVKVLPDAGDPWRWEDSRATQVPGAVLVTGPGAVRPERQRALRVPWLVYLLPVPVDRPAFAGRTRHYGQDRVWIGPAEVDLREWRKLLYDLFDENAVEAYLVDGVSFRLIPAMRDNSHRNGVAFRIRDPDREWLVLERLRQLAGR